MGSPESQVCGRQGRLTEGTAKAPCRLRKELETDALRPGAALPSSGVKATLVCWTQ